MFPRPQIPQKWVPAVIVAGLLLVAAVNWGWINSHIIHPGPSMTEVATAANAVSCNDSGFYLVSTLTGAKTTIYNCTFAPSGTRCVTYHGGVADDATAEVRIAFSSAISSGRPSFLG